MIDLEDEVRSLIQQINDSETKYRFEQEYDRIPLQSGTCPDCYEEFGIHALNTNTICEGCNSLTDLKYDLLSCINEEYNKGEEMKSKTKKIHYKGGQVQEVSYDIAKRIADLLMQKGGCSDFQIFSDQNENLITVINVSQILFIE